MKPYIVYKTTNLINMKYYIGVHDLGARYNKYYFGSGIAIKKAVKKHGEHNFIRETISEHNTIAEAFQKEAEIVNTGQINCNMCYNMTEGGVGRKTGRPANQSKKDADVMHKINIGGQELKNETRKQMNEFHPAGKERQRWILIQAGKTTNKDNAKQKRGGEMWTKGYSKVLIVADQTVGFTKEVGSETRRFFDYLLMVAYETGLIKSDIVFTLKRYMDIYGFKRSETWNAQKRIKEQLNLLKEITIKDGGCNPYLVQEWEEGKGGRYAVTLHQNIIGMIEKANLYESIKA